MTDRVLAFGAHPDDIEFTCAGTLARLKERGWDVHMAVMTPGDLGSAERSREEIAATRRTEAACSAEVLGASLQILEFRDFQIEFTDASRRRVTDAVRAADPRLVLAPPPADYMADHEITSQLVRDACFNASVPLYETPNHQATGHIPHLYYVDPIEGTDLFGRPAPVGRFIDVSDVMETKATMLAAHASQRDWLMKQHGMDQYLKSMRDWAAKRGAEASKVAGAGTIRHAEGFRQHLGHPYPHDDLLGQILEGVRSEEGVEG